MFESSTTTNLQEICQNLRELTLRRRDLIRSRTSLTNRIKAVCRRMSDVSGKDDKEGLKRADELYKLYCAIHSGKKSIEGYPEFLIVKPFFGARDEIENGLKSPERAMKALAMQLPVYEWVKSVRGFGVMNLACVIGETGDLNNYANPGKVWKRMGLAVIDGQRQRKTTDKELAIQMGYSPVRRTVMHLLGDSLVKGQGKGDEVGEYRKVYDARKAYELERNPEIVKAHAHARALRYMEKRVLRELWKVWRGQPQGQLVTHGKSV